MRKTDVKGVGIRRDSPAVWVICHFLEGWSDIEPIVMKLKKSGVKLTVICAEGNLYNGRVSASSYDTAKYLNSRGINFTILEDDFVKLVNSEQHFKKENIIVAQTQYPGSLSSNLAEILTQNLHNYYIPYGYPMNEITSHIGFSLDSRLHFCKVFTENLDESQVWNQTKGVAKTIISGRIFGRKFFNLKVSDNTVIINFHHISYSGLPYQGGRGHLIYDAQKLLSIFRNFHDFTFKLTFHPIFWDKLAAHDTLSIIHDTRYLFNLFLHEATRLDNVEVSADSDWKSEWQNAGTIFTESPSLLFKGSKLLIGNDIYAVSFGDSTIKFSCSAKQEKFMIVRNTSEIFSILNAKRARKKRLLRRVYILIRQITAYLEDRRNLARAVRLIKYEMQICEIHMR